MKIGILQTGHVPDEALRDGHGTYADMFIASLAGHGFTFTTYELLDGHFPDQISDQDGWIITGSRHGVYEDHAFIPPLESLIRDIHAAQVPLIGICFGHQIIAQALGGHVEKFTGGWRVGRQVYDWDGADVPLHAWHQDQVITPPAGARTIATGDDCAHAGLAIGDHILTLQPHPEFNAKLIELFINERSKGIVPDDLRDGAAAQLDRPVDNTTVMDRLAAHLLRGNRA